MIMLLIYDYKKNSKAEFKVTVEDGNKHKKTQHQNPNPPYNFKLYRNFSESSEPMAPIPPPQLDEPEPSCKTPM